MKHEDFSIGLEFYTATGKWSCTDIGTRTIVAIQIDKVTVTEIDSAKGTISERVVTDDQSWFNGPPYAVAESVFDELSLTGCSLDSEVFTNRVDD